MSDQGMRVHFELTDEGCQVTDERGRAVKGLALAELKLRPGGAPTARLTFAHIGNARGVAIAEISDDHLRQLAEAKGYTLTPKGQGE